MHSLSNLIDTKKQVHITKEGVLNFGIIDILSWKILCCGAVLYAVACPVAPSLPCLGDKQMSRDIALGVRWVVGHGKTALG